MKYGYARVSTKDQNPEFQITQLMQAGATKIFSENASSRSWKRSEWQRCLEELKGGDTLMVWRLDRAVASLEQLDQLMRLTEERKVSLVSLTEQLDTSSAMGRAMVQMIGIINQLRLDVMRENTVNGLEGARAKGVILGRRPILKPDIEEKVIEMVNTGSSQADVARLMRVSPNTISRVMAREKKRRLGI